MKLEQCAGQGKSLWSMFSPAPLITYKNTSRTSNNLQERRDVAQHSACNSSIVHSFRSTCTSTPIPHALSGLRALRALRTIACIAPSRHRTASHGTAPHRIGPIAFVLDIPSLFFGDTKRVTCSNKHLHTALDPSAATRRTLKCLQMPVPSS